MHSSDSLSSRLCDLCGSSYQPSLRYWR
jgi:hypothetical protein